MDPQVKIWRRAYAVPPPPLNADDKRNAKFEEKYKGLPPEVLPSTECLKDTVERGEYFYLLYVFSGYNNHTRGSLRRVHSPLNCLSSAVLLVPSCCDFLSAVLPYYFDEIAPALLAEKRVLVVGELDGKYTRGVFCFPVLTVFPKSRF